MQVSSLDSEVDKIGSCQRRVISENVTDKPKEETFFPAQDNLESTETFRAVQELSIDSEKGNINPIFVSYLLHECLWYKRYHLGK